MSSPPPVRMANRLPRIVPVLLTRIGRAESSLREWGFPEVRVRHHGRLARIEVPVERMPAVTREPLRSRVAQCLRALGYLHVCVDLLGFRSGSLNEALDLPGGEAPAGKGA